MLGQGFEAYKCNPTSPHSRPTWNQHVNVSDCVRKPFLKWEIDVSKDPLGTPFVAALDKCGWYATLNWVKVFLKYQIKILSQLKVAFFQKVRFVFQTSHYPKTLFQKTILSLKFE